MYVYIFKATSKGLVKIGISAKPRFRFHAVQQVTPFRITHVKAWKKPRGQWTRIEAYTIERAAHALLADRRTDGEWFTASPEEAIGAVRDALIFVQNGGKPVGSGCAGEISAKLRVDASMAKAETIRAEWSQPIEEYPTAELLARAGISRNTAKLYLGHRPRPNPSRKPLSYDPAARAVWAKSEHGEPVSRQTARGTESPRSSKEAARPQGEQEWLIIVP
jgi:hypothetical protein